MNFGIKDYVPVLKVKPAEKRALSLTHPAIRPRVIPLMEIVERGEEITVQRHLDKAFSGLAESLRPYPRCFLETREISGDGLEAAKETFNRAAALKIKFTPVTGISRAVDVEPALSHAQRGLAIRLTRDDFEQGGLSADTSHFMKEHGLRPETVDLIVDLGAVSDMITEGVVAFASAFVADIPDLTAWRTLTISGSAFPESMGVVERRSHALFERVEWIAWRNHVASGATAFPRIPTFSDCGIQHPTGVEGIDFRLIAMSAAVRYTLPEHWLLLKGVSNKEVRMPPQFQQLATQLVYGHLRTHFAGDTHCAGCLSAMRAANGRTGLGSLGVWRRIGTVHHIATVIEQLNALPDA